MPEVYETNMEAGMSSLAIVNTNLHNNHVQINAPIVSSYNDQIRPLLDTVDRLRSLNVMSEGIELPTISTATDDIAGTGKGISDTHLTLHVKKAGVPDITMIDLPGITRVSVNGKPENIYEQIAAMVMKNIEPPETIILNVLPATVDFTNCESICMSKKVDKKGERTLAVVTKVDKAPENLLQKVTSNDVGIGLGYVCVRNRIEEETYEDARKKEEELFRTHQLLSKIDKDIVGIPVLARKLCQIQAKNDHSLFARYCRENQ